MKNENNFRYIQFRIYFMQCAKNTTHLHIPYCIYMYIHIQGESLEIAF